VTEHSTAVVIQLSDEKYDRIVIGVDDPRGAVDAINSALAARD
jgi:hypothetical protein